MEYLKVWTSFREAIAMLDDAEKGRLFDAMLLYADSGEEPSEFKGNERFLWPVAKQDIDRTAQKCEALRRNGQAGGLQKARNRAMASNSEDQQAVADDSKSLQGLANDSNGQQTVASVSHKEKKSNIKKSNVISDRRFTPPTADQVREYCRERGNNVNPERFIDFYSSKGWKVGNQPMKDWKAAVRTWEQRDAAETAQKRPQKSVVAQQYEQREYSGEDSLTDILSVLQGDMRA